MLSARHIPNLLSGFRVAAAPLLVVLAEDGERLAFAFVMAAAFASDICDGFIARRFGFVSAFGSLLDSVADILLFSAILFGVWRFEQPLVLAHGPAFLAVLLLWLGGGALALLRYGKLASFHTRLTRLSAVALGLFVFI
ncbi:MAG TPA: CDP-alcohol phosphatidyltransferase family protein, partial [Rhizomicrobium sp.]|nr:CDP-alcohol phosphatidyltransferase family protein [Rhizomicrobium sp.]